MLQITTMKVLIHRVKDQKPLGKANRENYKTKKMLYN